MKIFPLEGDHNTIFLHAYPWIRKTYSWTKLRLSTKSMNLEINSTKDPHHRIIDHASPINHIGIHVETMGCMRNLKDQATYPILCKKEPYLKNKR